MSDLDRPAGKRKRKKATRPDHVHPLLDKKLRPFLDEVTREAGFGECSQLCDVGTVGRVCSELLPEAFDWARMADEASGEPSLLESLKQLMWEPLLRYAQQLEATRADIVSERESAGIGGGFVLAQLDATIEFMDVVNEVREHLRLGPWSEEDGNACSDLLERSWYKWIAHVAGSYISFAVPVSIARARSASARAKEGATPGRSPKFDQAKILALYLEEAPRRGRDAASHVAKRVGCTSAYVRALVRRSSSEKSETNSTG